jgi:DNA modification methylase
VILRGDCLELLKTIPDQSVDMVLTDPPYGTTACKWDSVIPFEPMWAELKRVVKERAAICLFGAEPFSSSLRLSNAKLYRYDWTWLKSKPSGHLNAKKQPMRKTECVSVFYDKQTRYFPQGLIAGVFNNNRPSRATKSVGRYVHGKEREIGLSDFTGYPSNVLEFGNPNNKALHPTQKPVALLEYLIKTYTLENETVLDFTMGSGSTGVACANTNRQFIGIELDEKYFAIAERRINEALTQKAGGA